ncbi:hypothetical protein C5167_047866 [Papaver somniferum]|uniref:Water stress and hypersensitive response domain-containing protein n=1 Tax=Papaver somniferum TaxID=3469 RepID=A0A4Y7LLK9_PAPSO|nr:hypothetical protein C5167_047866 [Papaver somniferum]
MFQIQNHQKEKKITWLNFLRKLNTLLLTSHFACKGFITNPFSVPIPIGAVDYTLKSLDKAIATGKMPDPGSIKANGITLLEVLVKVPYNILKSVANDVGSDWDIDYELLLGIIVDLPIFGNITIPLSHKGEFKLPTINDILKGGGGSKLEMPKNLSALKSWF